MRNKRMYFLIALNRIFYENKNSSKVVGETMSEEKIIKNYPRSPSCNEIFANKEHQNSKSLSLSSQQTADYGMNVISTGINDGFLTVKIVQCGNSRRMPSVSQSNPYDLCDTFQIKFPV